jgi:hypothetical protein
VSESKEKECARKNGVYGIMWSRYVQVTRRGFEGGGKR